MEDYRWKPGQSGNPKGRPAGSRNKLGEEFIAALYSDFLANAVSAIERARKEKPEQYLKLIASLVPKELKVSANPLEEASDDELSELLTYVRTLTRAHPAPKKEKPH